MGRIVMTIEMKKLYNIVNKGPAPYRRRKPSGSGFVILFAVTLSAIILAISLGVADIALKEVKFGTSAKDTNDAFFAADTGIEYVLFNDKPPTNTFVLVTPGTEQTWNIIVSGLGSANTGCAKVSIKKDGATSPPYIKTTVISKGYNTGDPSCASSNPNRIEREIKVTY